MRLHNLRIRKLKDSYKKCIGLQQFQYRFHIENGTLDNRRQPYHNIHTNCSFFYSLYPCMQSIQQRKLKNYNLLEHLTQYTEYTQSDKHYKCLYLYPYIFRLYTRYNYSNSVHCRYSTLGRMLWKKTM